MNTEQVAAERAVIGGLLRAPWTNLDMRAWLRAEDFTDPWLREMYRALVEHDLCGHPVLRGTPPELVPDQLATLLHLQLQGTAARQGWGIPPQEWSNVWEQLGLMSHEVEYSDSGPLHGMAVARASLERTMGDNGSMAEASLISSLLQDPRVAEQLRGWLHADDFAEPILGAMYRALMEQDLCRHPAVTQARPEERTQRLSAMMISRVEYDLLANGGGLPERWTSVHAWVGQITQPAAVPHPEYASLVGKRILEQSVQRTVLSCAGALDNAAPMAAPGQGMEELLDAMARTVDQMERRWNQATIGHTDTRAPHTLTLAPAVRPAEPAAEDALLASLVADPRQFTQVRAFLRPEDFAAPGRSQLYRTIQRAVDSSLENPEYPVNGYTIVLQAHLEDVVGHGAMSATEVWNVCQYGEPGQAVERAADLVESVVRHHTATAASAMRSAASTGAPRQLLGAARSQLRLAKDQASRRTPRTAPQNPEHRRFAGTTIS